jgi:hypothetical protein
MYFLDANVFIRAQLDYYPPERIPEFWKWLAYQAESGFVKVPRPVWDEIKPHDENLTEWMKEHQENLILDPDDSDILVSDVLDLYSTDLKPEDLEKIGADPFLIAAARFYGATVVSKEGSKPSKKGANRKIPDICRDFGVQCITDHKLIVDLNFRTQDW